MVGAAIRVTAALVVGVIGLPIGIIITLVLTFSIGKEAYDNEMKKAENQNESKNETAGNDL